MCARLQRKRETAKKRHRLHTTIKKQLLVVQGIEPNLGLPVELEHGGMQKVELNEALATRLSCRAQGHPNGYGVRREQDLPAGAGGGQG